MLRDIVMRCRSYRRFHQEPAPDTTLLRELVDLARLSASARNAQPLRFLLSCTPERNALIFPHLTWAGYLPDWPGPAPGERPTAYILLLGDTTRGRSFAHDCGIAAQSILLGATERGFGGCPIGSIDRKILREDLQLPERYEILLALALGKPAEEVVIEEVGPDGGIEYWRDEDGRHHVPKRALDELILK